MLVIRLQRVGKKHQASFRIVLQDSQWKPKGKSLELLGFYNPHTKEKQVQAERVKYWLEKGAQPSATLHNMFVDLGILPGPKVKTGGSKKGKGAAKKESEAKPAEVATEIVAESAPAEPVEEVNVEEPAVDTVIESLPIESVEEVVTPELPVAEEKEAEEETPIKEEAKKKEEEVEAVPS
ncbi:MAG: 30S ribosomal protein S16 [Patescibacteria group bacterium]